MVNLHTQGYPLVIFDWVTLAVTTPFVVARLYVQLRFRSKPWRELWVVSAYLLYFACTIDDSLLNGWDWFNNDVSFDKMTDAQVAPPYKVQFTWGFFYNQVLYSCKAALLCFYADLAPRHWFPKTWSLIIFSWVWFAVVAINHFLYQLLQCGPDVSTNWTWSKLQWNTGACTSYQARWSIASFSLHVFTDILVYIIPFVILRNVKLSTGQKRGAYAIFALGFINIASAVSSLLYNTAIFEIEFTSDWSEETWFIFDQCFMFMLPFQAASAIVIVCLPYCRRLWKGTKTEDMRPELEAELAAAHAAINSDLEDGRSSSGKKSIDHEITVGSDEK